MNIVGKDHSKSSFRWSLYKVTNFFLSDESFFFFQDLFTYLIFWLWWVFVAMHRLSLVTVSRCYSSCDVQASHCGGFFYIRAEALGALAQ